MDGQKLTLYPSKIWVRINASVHVVIFFLIILSTPLFVAGLLCFAVLANFYYLHWHAQGFAKKDILVIKEQQHFLLIDHKTGEEVNLSLSFASVQLVIFQRTVDKRYIMIWRDALSRQEARRLRLSILRKTKEDYVRQGR